MNEYRDEGGEGWEEFTPPVPSRHNRLWIAILIPFLVLTVVGVVGYFLLVSPQGPPARPSTQAAQPALGESPLIKVAKEREEGAQSSKELIMAMEAWSEAYRAGQGREEARQALERLSARPEVQEILGSMEAQIFEALVQGETVRARNVWASLEKVHALSQGEASGFMGREVPVSLWPRVEAQEAGGEEEEE